MKANIETKNIVAIIQNACDDFIKHNLSAISAQLKNNRIALSNDFSRIKIDNIGKNSWGVYAFHIKPKKRIATHEELKDYWETDLSGKKILGSPAVIQHRFKPLEIGRSTCFYIGKSESLAERIKQHIHQQTKHTTYGLKISERNKLHSDNTFEYSYFVMKVGPDSRTKDAMKCLLATLEKHLRDELKPLIGKQ